MELKSNRSPPHINDRDQWQADGSSLEGVPEGYSRNQAITVVGEKPGEYIQAQTSHGKSLDAWMFDDRRQPTVAELERRIKELEKENKELRFNMGNVAESDEFNPPDRDEVLTLLKFLLIGGVLATGSSAYATAQGVIPELVGWSVAGIFIAVVVLTFSIGFQLTE